MRIRTIVGAGLLSALAAAAPGGGATDPFPLRFGTPRVIGADARLGTVLDAEVGTDGRVFVVDYENARVVAFSPEGRLLWSTGRKGRGPGEFQLPYRVGVSGDGRVLVYDLQTSEISRLGPAGAFETRWLLPFPFATVDEIVALPNAQVAVSGVSTGDPRSKSFGVHRFATGDARMRHMVSFGPLPVVRDTLVARMWGAGAITLAANGDLLYTRRTPYEIYRFGSDGQRKAFLRAPFRTRGAPEDESRVERSGRSTTYATGDADVERPGAAYELSGGFLLVGRYGRRESFFDLFTARGRYLGSHRIPAEWGALVGYDARRGVVWMSGDRDDEPVLYRVPATLPSNAGDRR